MNQPYEDYRDAWIGGIIDAKQTSVQKGRAFALKIMRHWLDRDAEADEENENFFYCDGAGDGGIDMAYLQRGDADETLGDIWYLVQSKYGSAFKSEATLIDEGHKVVETLAGKNTKLSSLSSDVMERLGNFRQNQGENDKVVLIFATVDPLPDKEKQALEYVRSLGKDLPFDFGVEAISVRTIYDRLIDEPNKKIRVPLQFDVPEPGSKAELLVGTVTLPDVFDFLRAYKKQRGDLDLLYAQNVRLFLPKSKINKNIIKTLGDTPDVFGFYNNGITIVVSDYLQKGDALELVNPSVVNGCQTTRSIYEVFDKKENSGGKGKSAELAEWQYKAAQGRVIVKIVRVSENSADDLLHNIVLFTNSQNAVKDQDFLALEADFKNWQKQMAEHGIYLEIQRGGIDAQKALQNKSISAVSFDKECVTNAFDLLKVYGAGWLREPGHAWGKNKAFAPNQLYYDRIIESDFDVADLLECFHLQKAADSFYFGASGKKAVQTRRITRFLFYFVTLELLRRLLKRGGYADDPKTCTHALRLLRESNQQSLLFNAALQVVDSYMNPGETNSVFVESAFKDQAGGNLNNYLKSDQFAKREDVSPKLWHWLTVVITVLSMGTVPSTEKQITDTFGKELKPTPII